MTEDGPYGTSGGDPWTDVGTFMENGPLTAIEIYAGDYIEGLRARYNTIFLLVSMYLDIATTLESAHSVLEWICLKCSYLSQ